MKAVRIHEYGDNSVVRVEEIERPRPGPGELLVRVAAAAINPVDAQVRDGKLAGMLHHSLPLTLGCDVAGTVEESGPGVTEFQAGDPVYAYLNLGRLGAFADFTIVKVEEAAVAPKTLDEVHAAAVPVAVLTAWQALFDTAGLESGQTVLIHAASGGVGSMAVQLAKWKGCHVIGTASAVNREYLTALGADEFIDYKKQRFEKEAKHVDVVLDGIGGDTQERSFTVLKRGGFLVSLVSPPSEEKAAESGVRTAMVFVQPNGKRLAEVARMFEDGQLKTLVETTLPLAEAARGFAKNAKGGGRGKIVLKTEYLDEQR
ncbi:MAG: NADP-dependent oxidoreductase [Acidobacteriota bacterium]|nr:NADP-dependent oxidoreductase [Acidobacteriota bacterium]